MRRERMLTATKWLAGGLLALGLSVATLETAEAATRTVGTSPGCSTIQNCVNTSAPGDTIKIPRGEYFEEVLIPPAKTGLKLIGSCNNSAQPRRGNTGIYLHRTIVDPGTFGRGLEIQASGVLVQCVSVRHGDDGFLILAPDVTLRQVSGVHQNGSNVFIESNAHRYRLLNSILVDGTSENLTVEDAEDGQVSGNLARNSGGGCYHWLNAHGVRVSNNAAINCDDGVGFGFDTTNNATVTGNYAQDVNGNGYAFEGQRPIFLRNQSASSTDDGFNINCSGNCSNALIQGNHSEGTPNDADGFSLRASGPGLRVIGNFAVSNAEEGFEIDFSDGLVRGNRAFQNGGSDSGQGIGFQIIGDRNKVERNTARANVDDGFRVQGSDNLLRNNTSNNNLVDGFDVEGSDNRLEDNTAHSNEAEGFENNAAGNEYVDNRASGNRTDCAASTPPAVNSSNNCADGSNFAVPPEIERAVRRAE